MDLRISHPDQQAVKALGLEPQLTALLARYAALPRWPWRECWLVVEAGLLLFHFQRYNDARGEYRRVPVLASTLLGTAAEHAFVTLLHDQGLALPTPRYARLAEKILTRAEQPKVNRYIVPATTPAPAIATGHILYDRVTA